MDDFPENWNEFKCASRKAFEECKREISMYSKKLLELREKEDYLKSLCAWIDEEEIRISRDLLK